MYIYRVFPTGGMGGESPPPTNLKFSHTPNLEKFLPSRLPPLSLIFYPTLPPLPRATKQQFSSYNPIKTAFLAVVIALAPFLF